MSTDITRGPRICPSCGRENPPTAPRCALCSTPLNAAIQTTPAPTWGEVRLPSLPDDDAPRSRPPLKGCAAVAAAAGVGLLILGSFVVTFFTVCTATAATVSQLSPHEDPIGGGLVGILVGLPAAVLVVILVVLILRRCGWR